jgi:hypothetical protein
MKKAIISAIGKLCLSIALCSAFIGVRAQSITNPADKNIVVRYLGASDDQLLFNVAYENPNGSRFSVMVLDQDGTSLFQEVYTDRKFDKRFRLPRTDNDKLTFVIRDFRDADWKESFTIDTKVTENLVVTKVK